MMAAERWMKFYPRDWLGDAALRTCSAAARGLWIDMLCLMDGASPRGHLKLGRKKLDMQMLSGLVDIPPRRLEKLVDELQKAGVFSRTHRGIIYSRKMIREEKWGKNGAKGGKARWAQAAEKKEKIEKRIRGSMTPESRIQNIPLSEGAAHYTGRPKKANGSAAGSAHGGLPFEGQPPSPPVKQATGPPRDPPDFSKERIETSEALKRSRLVNGKHH
jgi:hypothetical protein